MVTAYLKLSNYCNMGCSHCYLPESVRADSALMDNEVFNKALGDIYSLIQEYASTSVDVIWHGGEPLQFDKEVVVQRVVQANNYFFSRGVSCNHSIQTSLINFDADWGEIIKKYFSSVVGVSVDPSSRTISGSSQRYQTVLEKRIQHAQTMGITVVANVCPTVDDIGNEGELLDWFERNDIAMFIIDRYNDFAQTGDLNRPTNLQHSKFLSNLMDESLARINKGIRVSSCGTLRAGISGILNGSSGDRWGTSCLEQFIVIDKDGKTNSCPDKISYEDSYNGSEPFAASKTRLDVVVDFKMNHPKEHCYNCEYFTWCGSGCPITINEWSKEGDCSGYKSFLKHLMQLKNSNLNSLRYYLYGTN
ncbi:hypothetical protein OTK49_26640 [Vibrio coralliirubri]|uniref:radical SAM protein n=1 Tax=Vibrio coralliirubri TaxID=1516159 RepID=UPI002283CF82|nr:radical SAM protein [Vibrio coralliirubri]MCY9866119.1 hypothetical protein [Vibrio coralliirubri]